MRSVIRPPKLINFLKRLMRKRENRFPSKKAEHSKKKRRYLIVVFQKIVFLRTFLYFVSKHQIQRIVQQIQRIVQQIPENCEKIARNTKNVLDHLEKREKYKKCIEKMAENCCTIIEL